MTEEETKKAFHIFYDIIINNTVDHFSFLCLAHFSQHLLDIITALPDHKEPCLCIYCTVFTVRNCSLECLRRGLLKYCFYLLSTVVVLSVQTTWTCTHTLWRFSSALSCRHMQTSSLIAVGYHWWYRSQPTTLYIHKQRTLQILIPAGILIVSSCAPIMHVWKMIMRQCSANKLFCL